MTAPRHEGPLEPFDSIISSYDVASVERHALVRLTSLHENAPRFQRSVDWQAATNFCMVGHDI